MVTSYLYCRRNGNIHLPYTITPAIFSDYNKVDFIKNRLFPLFLSRTTKAAAK